MKRQIVILALVLLASTAMMMQPALAFHPQFVLIVLAAQEVDALVDGESATLSVRAEIRIHPDGTAHGTFLVRSREGLSVLRAFAGEAAFDDDGALIGVEVSFIPRDGDDGLILFITPVVDGAEDCDIYDLIGPGVVGGATSVSFEADARIGVVGPGHR